MCWAIGPVAFFAIDLPSLSLAGGVGIALFTIQHNFADAYASADADWDIDEGSLTRTSFLIFARACSTGRPPTSATITFTISPRRSRATPWLRAIRRTRTSSRASHASRCGRSRGISNACSGTPVPGASRSFSDYESRRAQPALSLAPSERARARTDQERRDGGCGGLSASISARSTASVARITPSSVRKSACESFDPRCPRSDRAGIRRGAKCRARPRSRGRDSSGACRASRSSPRACAPRAALRARDRDRRGRRETVALRAVDLVREAVHGEMEANIAGVDDLAHRARTASR